MPSRPLAAGALLADVCGLSIFASVDMTSEEALTLTADDLADLRSLGATDRMLEDVQDLARRLPGRTLRIELPRVLVL